jgi:hypothetical protein
MTTDFVADFCGKTGEAWQNLTQEPPSKGSVTQTNVALPHFVSTIDLTSDIKLSYGQLGANLAHDNRFCS